MFSIKTLRSPSNWLMRFCRYATVKSPAGPSGAALKLGGGIAKKGAVMTSTTIQQEIEAETDPEKLVKYCCGLNFKKNQVSVEVKEDSAYPSWLFGLEKLDRIELDQLDKDTWEYWNRYNEEGEVFLRSINEKRFPERYIPRWLRELRPLY